MGEGERGSNEVGSPHPASNTYVYVFDEGMWGEGGNGCFNIYILIYILKTSAVAEVFDIYIIYL